MRIKGSRYIAFANLVSFCLSTFGYSATRLSITPESESMTPLNYIDWGE